MLKASFKWMFLIIGTTIGAGYASGREIWQFFGHGSSLAILLFIIFYSLSCICIMQISYNRKSSDYIPVLRAIVGEKLTGIYDVMILLYLFSTTIVMIAGSGATGQAFNMPYWWGIIVIMMALVFLFIRGINGLLSINQVLIPILIIGLLLALILFIKDQNLTLFSHWHEQHNWAASFPFTALNILPLVAILGAIGSKINSKSEIWIACIGSGLILGVITYIYNISLIDLADEILLYEIPLFAILSHYTFKMLIFMVILLWFAIFTTAAAGLLGIVTRLQRMFNKPLLILVVLTLLTMLPFSFIGFSNLVSFLYPLYGFLNLYVLARLLLFPIWKTKGINSV